MNSKWLGWSVGLSVLAGLSGSANANLLQAKLNGIITKHEGTLRVARLDALRGLHGPRLRGKATFAGKGRLTLSRPGRIRPANDNVSLTFDSVSPVSIGIKPDDPARPGRVVLYFDGVGPRAIGPKQDDPSPPPPAQRMKLEVTGRIGVTRQVTDFGVLERLTITGVGNAALIGPKPEDPRAQRVVYAHRIHNIDLGGFARVAVFDDPRIQNNAPACKPGQMPRPGNPGCPGPVTLKLLRK